MNRRLSVVLLSAVLGFGPARNARPELVASRPVPESIFIDGLMADNLEADEGRKKFFHAEIQRFPLVEPKPSVQKPMMLKAPGGIQMPPRGKAMDRVRAAEVYMAQQEWNRALYEIQQGLESDPNNLFLLRKGAAIAALARKFGVADEFFRRVVEAEPTNVPFLAGRGGVLIRLLRFKEAEELIQRALKADPHDLGARFNETCLEVERSEQPPPRGEWETIDIRELIQVADWLDADRTDYVAALTQDGYNTLCDVVLGPGSAPHMKEIVDLLRKGMMSFQNQQWADAEATLLKVREFGVRVVGLDMLFARIRFEMGDRARARALLAVISAKYPDVAAVQYNFGFVLLNIEDYASAVAPLEKAVQLDPADGQASFALACAYAGAGRTDEAWLILGPLAESRPSDLQEWISGPQPYLKAIQRDSRYPQLMAGRGVGVPESKPGL